MCIRDSVREDVGRLGVRGDRDRLVFPQAGRMGHCRPYAHRARHGRFGYGYRWIWLSPIRGACRAAFERRSQTYPRYRATESSAAIGVTPKEPHPYLTTATW